MLGHLIYNYQHLDDCKIQQEISRMLYAKAFGGVHLVHAYNGKKEFGYAQYLEDKFIKIKNRGHFQGAVDLINAGMEYFNSARKLPVRYVLVTAADTWLLNVKFVQKLVREMETKGQVLATSSWGKSKPSEKPHGFSTDFFIVDLEWNRKAQLWPLDYAGFVRKFADFFYVQYAQPVVEVAVQYQFQKYFGDNFVDNDIWRNRNASLRRIVEREPVHGQDGRRIDNWPSIGLYTSPEPKAKRAALRKLGISLGAEGRRLLGAEDLSYYNRV